MAACYTRISEFCSSLIRFPVYLLSVRSRVRVSCFSFFAFTSSPVCDKTLWDSSFGVKAFVNALYGALSSPLMRKKSMNCEVKVKAKIENSLCARYAQARVNDRSRKRRPHDRLRRKSQRGYHLNEGRGDKMRGGFARKSPFFTCSFVVSRNAKRFFSKISIFRDKMITFAVDKTQLTFFLAVLRRPYSAKSGPFPDESAHVIFDLLTYTAQLSPRAYLTTRRNGVGIFLG